MNEDNDKLYILEKIWKYKPGIVLKASNVHEVLIRPCNVSYDIYRNFLLKPTTSCKTIEHGGYVLAWCPDYPATYKSSLRPKVKSFEEFMIYANINMNITPLVENWIVNDEYSHIYAKTISLKTNEVWYDNVQRALKRLDEQHKMRLV